MEAKSLIDLISTFKVPKMTDHNTRRNQNFKTADLVAKSLISHHQVLHDLVKEKNTPNNQSIHATRTYVTGTTATGSEDAESEDSTQHPIDLPEQSLGNVYNEIRKILSSDIPDSDDVPILDWHLKLNHTPKISMQKLSIHPKFRALLQSMKQFKKLSCNVLQKKKRRKPHNPAANTDIPRRGATKRHSRATYAVAYQQ